MFLSILNFILQWIDRLVKMQICTPSSMTISNVHASWYVTAYWLFCK